MAKGKQVKRSSELAGLASIGKARMTKKKRFDNLLKQAGATNANRPVLKYKDTNQTFTSPTGSGQIGTSLCLVAAGDGEDQRGGNVIKVKSIMARGRVTLSNSNTAAENTDCARVMIYLDKQANGAAAAVTDILQTASSLSFNRIDNRRRFIILMDKEFVMNMPEPGAATLQHSACFQHYINLKEAIPIEFSSTSGVLTELFSNNIGMMVITKGGNANVEAVCRIRFTD